MPNPFPVVLVHGLFGWGPDEVRLFPYWRIARSVASPLPRHEASVGPISSTHDRACELAFQIKGGRVDYGAEHATAAGHHRFGRTYDASQAFHAGWSRDSPVHLMGHSMGGPTIWMLQHLLAVDYFGWGSDAGWVKSLSSISGVLNGSTAAYFLGCDVGTGLIRPTSVADLLARAIELTLRATGDLFDRVYDFDLDHWDLPTLRGESLRDYVGRIARSPMFLGKDNAAYCLTIQGLLEQQRQCATHPETFYLSYVTEQTRVGFFTGRHYPEPMMNPLMIPTALYIGHETFAPPFYPGFRSEDWWHNDGLVSVFSQLYPRLITTPPLGGAIDDHTALAPGRWYHQLLSSVDHVDIVAMPQPSQIGAQCRFYQNLFARLAAL